MSRPLAIIVDVINLETSKEEEYKRLEELEMLVTTYGGIVVVKIIQKRGIPDYQTYIGSGKVEEIKEMVKENKINLIIVNNLLKTSQIYRLTEIFEKEGIEVWDRVDLILKIFERHATSTEAKLQIELASIKHMGQRIYKMGTQLMQQKGGTAMRGGEGETNIEMMKRHLAKQEFKILEKLKHFETIREGHRSRRRRENFKTVALVGYTNAGKSSVLKALTKKDVYIADELFATLDTRVGNLYIPDFPKKVLISDTIGFIEDLPPDLIKAFKSTLAETVDADLILHIIDANDHFVHKKIEVVEDILKQIGAGDKPKIYVFNKIDLLTKHETKHHVIEPIIERKHAPSLLVAGEKTAHVLGWADKDKLRRNAKLAAIFGQKVPLKELERRYKHFTPVFISATHKTNLQKLVERIKGKI